uniref:PDZ domain-containing protein n=1 Tax=Heterorhabditis bacteriophora TaxID=37862 RepID=A0A1I7XG21_HETBA
MNGQRGMHNGTPINEEVIYVYISSFSIFISRVSLPSLSPMLSVGDEILYVDDELVKGRSLEHVQSLIAGKTRVVIVLLPSVGPALC